MEVILFTNFAKRNNSTKTPDDSTGIVKDIRIKSNFGFENQNQSTKCSINNPSFFLSDATQYTYLKAWDKYYFIDTIEYDINGAEYITCTLDVLASYKDDILATKAFVKYSSSNYNVNIDDKRIVPLMSFNGRPDSILLGQGNETTIATSANDYSYIVTVANASGLLSYVLSASQLYALVGEIMGPLEITQALKVNGQGAINAFQSIRIVPFTGIHTSGSGPVLVGNYLSETVPEAPFLSPTRPGLIRINNVLYIKRQYDDFRKSSSAFVDIILYLPFVGTIKLSPYDLRNSDRITIEFVGNAVTGACTYTVKDVSENIITTASGSFGVDMPIGTLYMNNPIGAVSAVGGLLSSGVMTVAGGVASGAFGGYSYGASEYISPKNIGASYLGISGAQGMSSSVSEFFQDVSSSSGTNGGYAGNYGEVLSASCKVLVRNRESATRPSDMLELYGRPCLQVVEISTLTGYVQTQGFSIDINSLSGIKQEINTLMDSGVYLE